jgi:hypothetical protein
MLPCLLFAVCMATSANADSLDGQTITSTCFFPDTSTIFAGPQTTVVPSGISDFAGLADVTFSSNNILITLDRNANVNAVAFDGFNFADVVGIFSTVTLDASSTYAGFDASRIMFNANQIFVNVADLPGLTGQTISLDINASASPTPEPSSLMMLGVGLLGLAGLALKGQRSQTSIQSRTRAVKLPPFSFGYCPVKKVTDGVVARWACATVFNLPMRAIGYLKRINADGAC